MRERIWGRKLWREGEEKEGANKRREDEILELKYCFRIIKIIIIVITGKVI